MTTVQMLALLLALSAALNIAFLTGLAAHQAGATTPRALATSGSAAATTLGLYFAAVAAYH
jgi:hypothetical protein